MDGSDGGVVGGVADGDGDGPFFQGSVSEAIARAQSHNLVLIVFVAGEDKESEAMELTTFRSATVLNEVRKRSLLLRLRDGSSDAAYFAALFPVRRVPTISFLGNQGAVLQQLEGYQDAEKFLTALRHVKLQRDANMAMAAILSSANWPAAGGDSGSQAPEPESEPEPRASTGNSGLEDVPVQSSSSAVERSSMGVDVPEPIEARPVPDAAPLVVGSCDGRDSGTSATNSSSSAASKPEGLKSSPLEDAKAVQNQGKAAVKQGNGKKTTLRREPSGGTKPVKPVRTGPFLLQVRLTNGETIQGTFESYQLLRDVKNFVDLQRTDGNMEFRLAIPFPRKLFSEEDMEKTLSKLDIGPRSALMLIASDNRTGNPSHSRASASNDAGSSSQSEATTAGGSYLGYFFSMFSPYVFGSKGAAPPPPQEQTNSPSASHSNTTRALREGAQPPMSNSSRPEPPFASPYNAGGSKPENTTQSGRLSQRRGGSGSANVHTLRKEDEGPSPGNTYWNGNSTQFGGNDESKED